MSTDVFYANESKKGAFGYERPSGTKVVAPLQLCTIPLIIVQSNPVVPATGFYELTLNQDITFVREIYLIAVYGGTTDQRRVVLETQSGDTLLDAVRAHTSAAEGVSRELIVSPGLNLGAGWLVKEWRDAGGTIPRKLKVTQKAMDGTPYAAANGHALTLYFNVVCNRFQ